ncbi:MAG TPA: hypothetical protein PKM65_04895 [Spirochaetota bacterium]|nr:hypothetical protein [Spirochaetota bacterium]HNT10312.1 hypothetical protein [Spirochaetota bacterium]
MKKHSIVALIGCIIFLAGCKTSYEYIITGKQYPPLKKDDAVKMVFLEDKGRYEELGIVEVTGKTLMKRVDAAVDVARKQGGDVLMIKGVRDEKAMEELRSQEDPSRPLKQSFLVLRTRPDDPNERLDDEDAPAVRSGGPKKSVKAPSIRTGVDDEGALDEADPSGLKRATWRLLVEEFEMLRGERFRASMYPLASSRKIPPSIDYHADGAKRLITMATRGRRHFAYLIVPKKMEQRVMRAKRFKRSFEFVYTPVDVYRRGGKTYPVLEFVREIEGAGSK